MSHRTLPESRLLYATGNPGKLREVRTFLGKEWMLAAPEDLEADIAVEESGETLEENALLKARAYHEASPGTIVIADDTGLEIAALGGEPGVRTRRWKDGTEMSDQALIRYCLERMRYVREDQRKARFRTVIAIILPDGTEQLVEGALEGLIGTDQERAMRDREPGFPFRGLFFVPEAGVFLGELEDVPGSVLTHRQRAVQAAVEWLQGYNADTQAL